MDSQFRGFIPVIAPRILIFYILSILLIGLDGRSPTGAGYSTATDLDTPQFRTITLASLRTLRPPLRSPLSLRWQDRESRGPLLILSSSRALSPPEIMLSSPGREFSIVWL